MSVKSASPKRQHKKRKQFKTEAEKEQALINLIIQIIVDATLREVYGEKSQ